MLRINDGGEVNSMTLTANTTIASLIVPAGKILRLIGVGGIVLIVTNAFSVAAGGVLDIGANHVVLKTATGVTEAALHGMVNDGRLRCEPSRTKTLAIVDNNDVGYTGPGDFPWPLPTTPPALDGTEMLIAFAQWADCNLDGSVDSTDLSLMKQGLSGNTPTKWLFGNFRYLAAGVQHFDVQTYLLSLAGTGDPANHDTWVSATTANLTWGSIVGGASASQTLSSLFANTGDAVALALPASLPAGIIFTGHVASGAVVVTAWNVTSSPVTPGTLSIGAKTSTP